MRVAQTVDSARAAVRAARAAGKDIGFAPTMGALHEGHLALIRRARRECGFVVVSIFVNPTQFGPGEDLDRYPRPLERDLRLCENEGADLVFTPEGAEMYPQGFQTEVTLSELARTLEGERRPGHFAGVCTVVAKLFNIVQPDLAYFGEKDYQQLVAIRRMTRDLNLPVEIVAVPTVRDADGLALSTRNVYLSPQEREQALAIPRGLRKARAAWEGGARTPESLRSIVVSELEGAGLTVDYVEAMEPGLSRPATVVDREVALLVAARAGNTRLIDNAILSAEGVTGDASNNASREDTSRDRDGN